MNYLDRKRPCMFRPVISMACSLSPNFNGLIRTNLATQQVDFVDENVAPQWSIAQLDLGSISECSAAGTWLLLPQIDRRLYVSELQDIWGSENWNVNFSVQSKSAGQAVLVVNSQLSILPSPEPNSNSDGLTFPALRLARSLSYDSCKNNKVRYYNSRRLKLNYVLYAQLQISGVLKTENDTGCVDTFCTHDVTGGHGPIGT